MKRIILVRHAKSSWDDASVQDRERPLNDRGRKNAPEMAKRLEKKEIVIDHILSSPAKRAKKTAELFAEELKIPSKHISYIEDLYMGGESDFNRVIAGAPDDALTIAIFSHNPGITEFANTLTNVRLDNMPTCSVFGVKARIGSWKEFAAAEKEFWFFDYPKSKVDD